MMVNLNENEKLKANGKTKIEKVEERINKIDTP